MHLHLYAQTVEYPCLTLKMKALCTFKTMGTLYIMTQCYIRAWL